MSELGTHLAIARARAGQPDPSPRPGPRDGEPGPHAAEPIAPIDERQVWSTLATVPDPELPVVSIVDLGMVHGVEVGPGGIRVTILPTFVGCPAIDLIRATINESLAPFGLPVVVDTTYDPPWTSERITDAGRSALSSAGIAPPAAAADVRCPFCASMRVVMDSAFGPTQCRSLFYCRACRQPFEAMKPV